MTQALPEVGAGKRPKDEKKRFYRKRIDFFTLLRKLKLWPSRKGVLHGIKRFEDYGTYAVIETHCHQSITVRNSKNSRAARWLRNKWSLERCDQCKVPAWKLAKYASTFFNRQWGSTLNGEGKC